MKRRLLLNFWKLTVFWLSDGGAVTVKQFQKLSQDDQQEILDFIADASAYEEIAYKGRRYILTHASPNKTFQIQKELEDYDLYDFVEAGLIMAGSIF